MKDKGKAKEIEKIAEAHKWAKRKAEQQNPAEGQPQERKQIDPQAPGKGL
jgi:hypothetical protein